MSDAAVPSRKVFIIGTHHTYQYGVGSTYGDGCTKEEEFAFRHLVESAAAKFAARALAEELNEDGLSEHNVTLSVLQLQAAALGLPHCFCEPGRAERAALGIQQGSEVEVTGWIRGWSQDEVKTHLLAQFHKRETVWCDRLLAFDKWPVLFVCGADHVDTFSSLLPERGMEAEVLETCWEERP